MITSIVKIKYCPSFNDFKPKEGLPPFKRLNLIYGWNGSGKTSFSRVLRSFELGNNYYNDPSKPGEFEFKLGDGSVISNKNLVEFKQVRVFNKDFIDESVFRDDGPRPIFYLGTDTKEDKDKIGGLESQLAELKGKQAPHDESLRRVKDSKGKLLTATAKEIRELLTTPSNSKYRNYEKPQLENEISSSAQQLLTPATLELPTEALEAAKRSILQTSKLPLGLMTFPSIDLTELVRSINSELQKTVVSQTIQNLKDNPRTGRWAKEGLDIHKEAGLIICAFCDQEIPDGRIHELEQHFNDEFQSLMASLATLKTRCRSMNVSISLPDASLFYDDLSSDYLAQKKEAEEVFSKFHGQIEELIKTLEAKEQSPFTKIAEIKLETIDSISFVAINDLVKRHNEKTENFKVEVEKEMKSLELHVIAGLMPTYNDVVKEISDLTAEQARIANEINRITTEIDQIKAKLFSHQIPVKQINGDLQSFLGRDDIKFEALDDKNAGYLIKRNRTVAKNLSEGEKTAVALVYFLAKLGEDGFDMKKGVIVIDDPVSSMDSSALFQAFSFIKNSIDSAEQIIILTHHFGFFRQVRRWFYHGKKNGKRLKKEQELYMVVCHRSEGIANSELWPADKMLKDYESEYQFLFSVLYEFSKKGAETLEEIYPIPNIARKFLESFLSFRVPSEEMNMTEQLEAAGPNTDPKTKTRIEAFVQTHSHLDSADGAQDFDASLLGEAKDVVGELLDFVKDEDPRHFGYLEGNLPAPEATPQTLAP
jgi:wobble nucleotide-excising tRNase